MLNVLKKSVFNILCNNVTGSILLKLFKKIPDLRWRGYSFFVNRPRPNKTMVASIFFGFYESAEIRLIHKYFKGNTDVVEAGGSLGIVSSHICSLLGTGKKQVVIEANPFLKDTIQANLGQFGSNNFKVVSAAIGYDSNEISFTISDNNTESRVNNSGSISGKDYRVPALPLAKVLQMESIRDYALVSDIEGSEIGFLVNDADALQQCRQLFIELHNTSYRGVDYSVDQLVDLILKTGFKRVDNEGPVYYFERKNLG